MATKAMLHQEDAMKTRITALLAISLAFACGHALAQVVDNPGFKALPRPINYATPLAPAGGTKAVIVYGKNSPWTQAAATAVQKAIEDWSGVKLDLADDRTVTSEETYLLNDAYRKTPLIVLGNVQDNRVMLALGTRYLLRTNRTWPGGDRFIIRSIFEPFVADVNYVTLEASNQAGMDAAAARFATWIKGFPMYGSATLPPCLHYHASLKDKWEEAGFDWKAPPEWSHAINKSITELTHTFKGKPSLAGTAAWNDHVTFDLWWWMQGGVQEASDIRMNDGDLRAHAAMTLLGCRAQGGRTHGNFDHYGALASFMGIRAAIQAGVLSPEELNEFESCMVLSTAMPLDYVYNQIGDPNGGGNRHYSACLLSTAVAVDYVLNHCKMDDKTRSEMRRRHDNVRKSAAPCVRTFMDGDDSDCLGEDVLMQANTLLHEGFMDYVRNGNLRRSADLYTLSVDNMPGKWGAGGQYIGLYGFTSNPGAMLSSFWGGGLVEEAALYYDDPQIRWLAKNWTDVPGSRGGGYYYWGQDRVGPMTRPVVPTTYDGVKALPYDERLYNILLDPAARREEPLRLPPESLDKGVFRVAFRDDFDTQAAYLGLTGSSNPRLVKASQNNMIARFTDLAEVWLYTNVNDSSGWVRNVVSISNGKSYVPRTACSLDALANLGEVTASATREPGVAGADWTRNIVHWRGHYFVVIDRMEALADPASQGSAEASDFSCVCRWRSPQLASLKDGLWTAVAPSGSKMRIQNAEPVFQTSEFWEIDGAARPYVLQQYKHAKLAKGQAQTFQNLLYVWGKDRPDEFEARRVNPQAMMVKGRTAAGDHLALIGVRGEIPLDGFETDAAIYDVAGNTLHLIGATALKARIGTEMREIFWSQKPVNVLVDCETGKGEIEVRGDAPVQVKTGETWVARKPGREAMTFAQAGVLPKSAGLVEAMWGRSKAVEANTSGETAGLPDAFEAKPTDKPLQRPLKRLTNADITCTPRPHYQRNNRRMWKSTDGVEITLTLPEAQTIGCLRLVGVNKEPPEIVGRGPLPAEWIGTTGPIDEPGDMKFSLVLSDDGFKNDLRKIDEPKVTTEFTSDPPADHTSMQHFLTWRIEVGQKARQVKLLPRATDKERAKLDLRDIQVYGAQWVDELAAKVCLGDLRGDGSNELVVGTSQRQLAAYDADGRQMWIKDYPGDILKLDTADMNGDGKAEAVAYLTTETLHQVKADGTEGPTGDVLQGERDHNNGCWGVAGAFAMAIWAPDGQKKKEALLFTEWSYGVEADGSVRQRGRVGLPLGAGRLVNMYPNEPEVLVEVGGRDVDLWSARRDKNGLYTRLGSKPQVAGPDGGELAWVQQVDVAGVKGFLAAAHNGVNFYPLATFQPNNHEKGWEFSSGGVPAVAALLADIKGEGVPQVFMARLDGFVNVLKLADGSVQGVLNTGEPILGLAALKGKDGKPRLAVGTKFGVHLFGGDLKEIGNHKLPAPAAGFAGPGGKNKDCVYVVDVAGNVTVLTVK
jgi:hypothetical protein